MGLNLYYKSVTAKPIPGAKQTFILPDLQKIQPTQPIHDSRSLSSGYRELCKNKTLAGRRAARQFTGQEQYSPPNRLRQVSRLRHKEKALAWRHVISDLARYVMSGFNRFNPARVLVSDPYADALRRIR